MTGSGERVDWWKLCYGFNCGEPFSQCGISKYRSFGNTATVRRGILNVYCDTLCRDTTPFPPRTHTDIPTNNSDTGHNLHPLTYYLRNPALKSGRTPHTTSSEPKSFTSNSHPPARRRLGTASGVTSDILGNLRARYELDQTHWFISCHLRRMFCTQPPVFVGYRDVA
ncbi:uncharacterized protein LAJ45_02955 [Morchella importuna]|uniref:uncharacterized protein n=1 Tax=Morchella importuna TaxID=1174673 RepID=UPI001E8E96DA|nr:uncharacterized protein LAJ45_02955 [Morchella importuna]KAH8152731.1 hypothetical protein LAJ45_02955 [Morchella importuna]